MHFRVPRPPAKGVPRTVFVLFIWLAPVVAITAPIILSDDPSGGIITRPYLQVAGVMPLRFAEAAPPPDLSTQLPAGAPPKLISSSLPSEPPAEVKTGKPVEQVAIKPATAPVAPVTENTNPPEKANASSPLPILPDDTRPKVKAEDFLPFFQFPGNSTNDAPTPPAPGRQPPSSATYRQQ